MLRTWTFGEIVVTMECPEALRPQVSVWFHSLDNDHTDVIDAIGGLRAMPPLDPSRETQQVEANAEGCPCALYVVLGRSDEKPPSYEHPVAGPLRREQDELARQTDDSAADEAGNR